jgi:hypothetical protein
MVSVNASTGFVAVYRSLLDNPLFTQHPPEYLKIFLYCLLRANYRPRKWWDGRGEIDIPIGGFISSSVSISDACKTSRAQVRRALDVLETSHMIEQKPATKYTLYVVVNYKAYQNLAEDTGHLTATDRPPDDQQIASKRPPNDQQAATDNKGIKKQVNKGISTEQDSCATAPRGWKDETFERFWDVVWNKTGKVKAAEAWKRKIGSETVANLAIAAAIRQKDRLQREGLERIGGSMLHPATWINGGRWDDEEPVQQALALSTLRTTPNSKRFIEAFLSAGVPLSDPDIKAACEGTKFIRGFFLYSEEEQSVIISAAEEKARKNGADTMGYPVNFMGRMEWTRRGPGRLLPEPRKQSRAEIGQAKAAAEFLAEGGD